MQLQLRHRAIKRITLIGGGVNALLALLKIVLGSLGQSHALIADGLHSIADLLTDALVLLASRFASRDADHNHPYGHQRIETAATVAVALVLILTSFGIMYDAATHLFLHSREVPKTFVLWIAMSALVVNEGLFHITHHIASRIQSNLLKAQAWHRRSDAAASVVVLIGVVATLLGFGQLDAIAALIVACMILKMGIKLGWQSLRELVDTAADDATVAELQRLIVEVPGVRTIHQLRTRSMGSELLVDVHILVDPYLTVSEGHHISEHVQQALSAQYPHVRDVTVHIDPEDDEVAAVSQALPPRNQLIAILHKHWQGLPGGDQIKAIRIHYLGGKIEIEVVLPLSVLSTLDPHDLSNRYRGACADLSCISQLALLFRAT